MQRMTHGRASRSGVLRLMTLAALWGATLAGVVGCGPVIMLNKMIFGDPTNDCPFKLATGVNLVKGEHKVVVVCTAPAAIRDGDMTGLGYTLLGQTHFGAVDWRAQAHEDGALP